MKLQNLFYHELFLYSDLSGTRLTLAMAEIIWAIALFWPGDTFERPAYEVMAAIASERTWATVFLISGCIQFFTLFRRRYHCYPSVCFALANATLWWTAVLSMYMAVSPPPAAVSGELALAFAASWVFIRSGFLKDSVLTRCKE